MIQTKQLRHSLKLIGYGTQKQERETTFDILLETLYAKYTRIRIKYYLKDKGKYPFIESK